MRHDEDWHPVLIKSISPMNSSFTLRLTSHISLVDELTVYFCAPERDETYGDVKLACFRSASVASTTQDSIVPCKANADDKYQPPVGLSSELGGRY